MNNPLRVEDFHKVLPLKAAYEFKPGFHYLVVCDGKDFPYGMAHALLKDLSNLHPELEICVVATLKPRSIEVREQGEEHEQQKSNGTCDDVPGTRGASDGPGAGDTQAGR
jgi:hypothetical protein